MNKQSRSRRIIERPTLSSSILPHDLIIQILLRLPVRSLLRFKSVCKSLQSLISDPQFCKSHFDLAAAPTHRCLTRGNHSEIESLDVDAPLHNESSVVNLRFLLPMEYSVYGVDDPSSDVEFLGSCRGFVLVAYPQGDVFVWNPATGVRRRIAGNVHWMIDCINGFGYDRLTDDYLLVLIELIPLQEYHEGDIEANDPHPIGIRVFSIKTNSWFYLQGTNVPYIDLDSCEFKAGQFLNQALHWLVISYETELHVIMAFDLVERSLSEIPLSQVLVKKLENKEYYLQVLGECLSLSYPGDAESMVEIWMMKDYKVPSSWTKLFVFPTCNICHNVFFPICFTKHGEIFGSNGFARFVIFNDKGLLLDQCTFNTYRESLLQCGDTTTTTTTISTPSNKNKRFEGDKQLMGEYSGKRGINGVVVPRKNMGLLFRDTANTRDRNGKNCSRLGCSSKVNPMKVAHFRSSEEGISLRSSMRSSSSCKEAIGCSSRTTRNPGKPSIERQKMLSFESDSSETSSVSDESEKFPIGLQAEKEIIESSNVMRMKVQSSSVASNTQSQRNFDRRPGLRQQEIKSTSPVTRAVASKYGLQNLRCNTISDIIPTGCSSSDSTFNKRKGMIEKRNCEGESSSTVRGKKMTGSSMEGLNSGPRNSICTSDSRRSINVPSHRDSITASVRAQRSISSRARGIFSSQGNEHQRVTNGSPVTVPLLPHSGNAPGVSYPLGRPSSFSRPISSSEQLYGVMPVSPAEYSTALTSQDRFRRYNMDGISEVLLALERIEQDEELTHEQILLLETNLFLNGLNFDHHRDMRLDIDSMSYEELLSLEEKMGTVSTTLTEEALSACLKRSIFEPGPTEEAAEDYNEDKDDIKCCICQEEYIVADEVGTLQCEHIFHVVCIQEWLRLKNWCPICKEEAALSNSSSTQ